MMGLVSGGKRGWGKIDIFGQKIKKPLAKPTAFWKVALAGSAAARGEGEQGEQRG